MPENFLVALDEVSFPCPRHSDQILFATSRLAVHHRYYREVVVAVVSDNVWIGEDGKQYSTWLFSSYCRKCSCTRKVRQHVPHVVS